MEEAQKIFRVDKDWRPIQYIDNKFEEMEDFIIDRSTNLMWEKSNSGGVCTYEEAQEYIEHLNREEFAGYADWRLPTIAELMSLIEREEQSNGLYLDRLFGEKLLECWSSNKRSSEQGWSVNFSRGHINWSLLDSGRSVRAVRSQ